jgi:hypothetical protein
VAPLAVAVVAGLVVWMALHLWWQFCAVLCIPLIIGLALPVLPNWTERLTVSFAIGLLGSLIFQLQHPEFLPAGIVAAGVIVAVSTVVSSLPEERRAMLPWLALVIVLMGFLVQGPTSSVMTSLDSEPKHTAFDGYIYLKIFYLMQHGQDFYTANRDVFLADDRHGGLPASVLGWRLPTFFYYWEVLFARASDLWVGFQVSGALVAGLAFLIGRELAGPRYALVPATLVCGYLMTGSTSMWITFVEYWALLPAFLAVYLALRGRTVAGATAALTALAFRELYVFVLVGGFLSQLLGPVRRRALVWGLAGIAFLGFYLFHYLMVRSMVPQVGASLSQWFNGFHPEYARDAITFSMGNLTPSVGGAVALYIFGVAGLLTIRPFHRSWLLLFPAVVAPAVFTLFCNRWDYYWGVSFMPLALTGVAPALSALERRGIILSQRFTEAGRDSQPTEPVPLRPMEPDVKKEAARTRWWLLALALAGPLVACLLFLTGMRIPFAFRVRGDAADYLAIARGLGSLKDVILYVGSRAPGFPGFEWLFRQENVKPWTDSVCLVLVIFHECVVGLLCATLVRLKMFARGSFSIWSLFATLACYPAFVLHTTTPLTDTFGADWPILAFMLLALTQGRRRAWAAGMGAGVALGYATLLRPSYGPGCVVALVAFGFARWRSHGGWAVALLASAAFGAVLLPTLASCHGRYGGLCVESPGTFSALAGARSGLRGARTLWFLPQLQGDGNAPTLPDAFMGLHFGNRCQLTSFAGLGSSGLLGCMLSAPQYVPGLLFKKWTGLFDVFRLTPYTELMTPEWYPWLARTASSLAFAGQWVLLATGIGWIFRRTASRWEGNAPVFVAVWLFSMTELSLHSLIHVEERYSLAWAAWCLVALWWKASEWRAEPLGTRLLWLSAGIAVVAGFWWQVLRWDDIAGAIRARSGA